MSLRIGRKFSGAWAWALSVSVTGYLLSGGHKDSDGDGDGHDKHGQECKADIVRPKLGGGLSGLSLLGLGGGGVDCLGKVVYSRLEGLKGGQGIYQGQGAGRGRGAILVGCGGHRRIRAGPGLGLGYLRNGQGG